MDNFKLDAINSERVTVRISCKRQMWHLSDALVATASIYSKIFRIGSRLQHPWYDFECGKEMIYP